MIHFILVLILYSIPSFSNECDETSSETSVIENALKDKCIIDSNTDKITSILPRGRKEFCQDCETKYQLPDIEKRKDQFVELVLDSARKKLSNITVELMSLRKIKGLNSTNPSEFSCNLNELLKEPCGKFIKKEKIETIQRELANDIVTMLRGGEERTPSLFGDRSKNTKQCEIEDAELLGLKNIAAELIFEEKVYSALKNADPEKIISLSDLKLEPRISDLLLDHPIFRSLFKNPKSFKSVILDLKATQNSQAGLKLIKSEKYNREYFAALQKSCDDMISSIKSEMCSNKNFEEGNIFSDKVPAVFNKMLNGRPQEVEASAKIWCFEVEKSKEALKFSKIDKILNEEKADEGFNIPHFDSSRSQAYSFYFDTPKETYCRSLKINCDQNSNDLIACTYKKAQQALKDDLEKDRTLAKKGNRPFEPFTDPTVNKFLASMLGNAPGIDKETREILQKEHLLPDEKGNYVPQPKEHFESSGSSYTPVADNTRVAKPILGGGNANVQRGPSKEQKVEVRKQDQRLAADNTYVAPPAIQPTSQTSESLNSFYEEMTERLMNASSTSPKTPIAGQSKAQRQTPFSEAEVRKMIEQKFASERKLNPNFTPPSVTQATDDYYEDLYRDLQKSNLASGGSFAQGGSGKAQRTKKQQDYDRVLAEALEMKYKNDRESEAKKLADGKSQLGESKGIVIEAGSVNEVMSKIESQSEKIKGTTFVLTINGEQYVVNRYFDITDFPRTQKGQETKRQLELYFDKKFPNLRGERLRYLRTILSQN